MWPDIVAAAPALVRQHARTALRRAGWRNAPRRSWVATIVPEIVAAAESDGDWFTEHITVSDTGIVVSIVRCRASGRRRVVKMPCTAEGAQSLRRQAAALTALHSDGRLSGWLDVVPRPRASGEIAGRSFWVEDAVRGIPVPAMASGAGAAGPILTSALGLIEDLHARTGGHRTLGAADVAEWIDRPLSRLATFHAGQSRRRLPRAALQRLGAELSEALSGRRTRTAWIHGDFWAGNLLASGSVVTGIVDWDRAGPDQLPLHDLLHLAVFARRVRDRCELGEVVVRSLRDGLDDATGLTSAQLDRWLDGVPHRTAVLLFWLRHISLFIGSEGHGDNRDWVRRNVDNVLACC